MSQQSLEERVASLEQAVSDLQHVRKSKGLNRPGDPPCRKRMRIGARDDPESGGDL